jgi:hypothetical protein
MVIMSKVYGYTIDPSLIQFPDFCIAYGIHKGIQWTPQQIDIINWVAYGDIDRAGFQKLTDEQKLEFSNGVLTMAPRGYGKTTIVALLICWVLYLNPEADIVYTSGTALNCTNVVGDVRRILKEFPPLEKLSEEYKDNSKMGSYTTEHIRLPYKTKSHKSLVGKQIMGVVAGLRASILIVDDIENDELTRTEENREKLRAKLREFRRLASSSQIQRRRYFGTPWCMDSVYFEEGTNSTEAVNLELTGRPAKKLRVWTALVPLKKELEQYRGFLAPKIMARVENRTDDSDMWQPTCSFIESALPDLKREYAENKYDFYMNRQMNPFIQESKERAFSISRLGLLRYQAGMVYKHPIVVESQPHLAMKDLTPFPTYGESLHLTQADMSNPAVIEPLQRVMFIDPSGKSVNSIDEEDLTSDETGVAIGSIVNGKIVIEYVTGFTDGFSDATYASILQTFKEFNCDLMVFEDNYGGGLYRKHMQLQAEKLGYEYIAMKGIRVTTRKEKRIHDNINTMLSTGNLFITERAVVADMARYNAELDSNKKAKKLKYTFMYQFVEFYLPRAGSPYGAKGHDDRIDAVAGLISTLKNSLENGVDAENHREDEEKKMAYERDLKKYGSKDIVDLIHFGKVPKYFIEGKKSPEFVGKIA